LPWPISCAREERKARKRKARKKRAAAKNAASFACFSAAA
jgi:hypothetical protein